MIEHMQKGTIEQMAAGFHTHSYHLILRIPGLANWHVAKKRAPYSLCLKEIHPLAVFIDFNNVDILKSLVMLEALAWGLTPVTLFGFSAVQVCGDHEKESHEPISQFPSQ